MSLILVTYIIIDFHIKIEYFQTYVLYSFLYFTYFELYFQGCFKLHLASIDIQAIMYVNPVDKNVYQAKVT